MHNDGMALYTVHGWPNASKLCTNDHLNIINVNVRVPIKAGSTKINYTLFCACTHVLSKYKVVQIWPGQTVTCLHTISPGHIWTTLYKLSYRYPTNHASCENINYTILHRTVHKQQRLNNKPSHLLSAGYCTGYQAPLLNEQDTRLHRLAQWDEILHEKDCEILEWIQLTQNMNSMASGVKKKTNFAVEQVMKDQRGSRGITLLFL